MSRLDPYFDPYLYSIITYMSSVVSSLSSPSSFPINILNCTASDLSALLERIGEKPFRAKQIIQWVHQRGVTDFMAMSNLSLALRRYLQANASITPPQIIQHVVSVDGTQKWLLQLADNTVIETVFIPEQNRGTLCISTQVGCALGCAFCATGTLGFKRNLALAEIIGQVWLAVRELAPDKSTKSHCITNVVMMGMGEPLLNVDNVISAANLLRDDLAYGLSKYRVTISTAGVVPAMQRLRNEVDVALAVSLHAPNDSLRDQLMPINKKYPLAQLIPTCREYYSDVRRKVTFEYVMLNGINDTTAHAKQLVRLISNVRCKVNLIVGNTFANSPYRPSPQETIDAFRRILLDAGINTITRKTRGADIAAACGQLAGKKL